MEKWVGKIAVITGGSSGIGSAVAEKFQDHGIIVVVLDLNEDENYNFHKCDVASIESIKEAFKWIEQKFNFIHILINCAGIVRRGKVTNNSGETTKFIDDVIATNFNGIIHVSRAACQLMKKSNDYGLIVNLGSLAGHYVSHLNWMMIYPATKFAVRAFSETLRQELIQDGDEKIRVTNLSPSMVKTNLGKNANETKESKEIYDKLHEMCPIILNPEDIANSIIYLLSTPYNVNVTELTIRPIMDKF